MVVPVWCDCHEPQIDERESNPQASHISYRHVGIGPGTRTPSAVTRLPCTCHSQALHPLCVSYSEAGRRKEFVWKFLDGRAPNPNIPTRRTEVGVLKVKGDQEKSGELCVKALAGGYPCPCGVLFGGFDLLYIGTFEDSDIPMSCSNTGRARKEQRK